MRVLVCDDVPEQLDQTVSALKAGGILEEEIVAPDKAYLEEQITGLFQYVREYLKALENHGEVPTTSPPFDDFDIIFLDNNLSHLDIGGARITAETIAGYIRTYSKKPPYIVSLNKNPEVDFDLRYLIGDYFTTADLALNTNHLSNRGLWTGHPDDALGGFLPSYWPKLLDEPNRRRKQVVFINKNLDMPIFKAMGIPEETTRFISRHATGFISPEAEYVSDSIDGEDSDTTSVTKVTFRKFFEYRNRSVSAKEDRDLLLGDMDSKSSSAATSREYVARAIAADIDLWIRRDLLAPQDALVDLPHLLVRMPFLLGSKAADISSWNLAIQEENTPYGLEEDLFDRHLRPSSVAQDFWVPAHAFYWPMLRSNNELSELVLNSGPNE